jgi:hypothetical protein
MKAKRVRKDRLRNEADGFICRTCGCGFRDDEQRHMQAWDGSGGSGLSYWHAEPVQCIVALQERVSELEKVIACQAMQLMKESST